MAAPASGRTVFGMFFPLSLGFGLVLIFVLALSQAISSLILDSSRDILVNQ
jgi:hypothetical protein